MALLSNIRLTWKNLAGTNTLAYFASLAVTKKKTFLNFDVQVEQQREMEGLLEVRKPVQTGLNQRPIL